MTKKPILQTAGNIAVPLLIALCWGVTGTVGADEGWSTVKGKTYDVWVSPSHGTPPFQPFHDCARFTQDTMTLDGCSAPNTGPLTVEINLSGPVLTVWSGQVPCGGLNLVWLGTSLDAGVLPQGADVMGASGLALDPARPFSYGMEGVRNEDCVLQMQDFGGPRYVP